MRFLKVGLATSLIFVVVVTAWVIRQGKTKNAALPIYGRLESFQLVDQSNVVFESQSLLGRVSIVNFIFTSCPHVCPVLTRQMAKIQDRTTDMRGKLQLVSISVDPATDTPQRLTEYGKKHGADFSRWVFLTGPIEALRKVIVNGFMNAMGEGREHGGQTPDLFEITHGENFVVLDKLGSIRAFRQVKTDRDIDGILKITQQLSKEGEEVIKTAE